MNHVQKNGIELYLGNAREVLKKFPDNSVDSVVTDPPAGISFMNKKWDANHGSRDRWIDWLCEIMVEVVRVLKPGGHALVWALPRTSHWTATACEDAGFECRDRICHLFGQGFPKSLNVSVAIDKEAKAEREVITTGTAVKRMIPGADQNSSGSWIKDSGREYIPTTTIPSTDAAKQWDGWGTALKPACEDWWLLRKPLSESTVAANVLKWGTGAINVDACRVIGEDNSQSEHSRNSNRRDGEATADKRYSNIGATNFSATPGPRGGSQLGRFPSNVTHDGSQDVIDIFPVTTSGKPCGVKAGNNNQVYGQYAGGIDVTGFGDTGSAARFFPVLTRCLYTPKANSDDRGNKPAKQMPLFGHVEQEVKNTHPTVKPQLLMEWLIKLITPPGGVVLDCFAGSCSTGVAAKNLGFKAILIEREQEYFDIGCQRLGISRTCPTPSQAPSPTTSQPSSKPCSTVNSITKNASSN